MSPAHIPNSSTDVIQSLSCPPPPPPPPPPPILGTVAVAKSFLLSLSCSAASAPGREESRQIWAQPRRGAAAPPPRPGRKVEREALVWVTAAVLSRVRRRGLRNGGSGAWPQVSMREEESMVVR